MFEYILKLSIQHRSLVLVAVFAMVMLGIHSYQKLPIDAVPDITNVQVQINTAAPGYSPQEAEQRITFPIEMMLAGLPELDYTRSLSRYGLSQVTVVFKEGTDIYFARQLVSQRIQEAKSSLPDGIEPRMGPISTGLGEIYMWTVQAHTGATKPDGTLYNSTDLREIQDWIIRPQLLTVPGVTEINSIGGYVKQFHVTPYADKLISVGLTLNDVTTALAQNNINVGAGYIEKSGEQYLVRVPGQVANQTEIGEILLSTRHGIPVRVKDVADVLIGKELRTGAATQNGIETVIGTAHMLIGENSRIIAQAAAEKLVEINRSLPEGIEAIPVYDRIRLVDNTIDTVASNLLEGAILVIAVLFVFLGNIRAALITALIIPLSMLFTFSGMVANNVSANLMSLGALDFGIIVDGTIVIIENCIRHLAQEQARLGRTLTLSERLKVVFTASREARKALFFGEFIIIIVYIPIFALSGVEGKMFHPMAFTVVTALVGAFILSVTFVPAAIALFMTGKVKEKESTIVVWAKKAYTPALQLAMHNKALVVTITITIIIVSGLLATRMGSEFVPKLNEGDMALHAIRIPGTSLTAAVEMQYELEKKIKSFPEVDKVFAKIGTAEIATDPMPPSVADVFIILKPESEWSDNYHSKADLVEAMERAVKTVPGNNYEFTQPIEMRFNELLTGVRADVAIKLFGDDMDTLLEVGEQIEAVLATIPGAADVRTEQVTGLPILTVQMDRTKMARYGLNVQDVQDTIMIAIGGRTTGLVYEGDRRFELQVRMPEQLRGNIEALKRLPIRVPMAAVTSVQPDIENDTSPAFVTLGEVSDIQIIEGPNQISRENAKRRVVVSANVRGQDLGTFVQEAQQQIDAQVKIPPGYWTTWGGQYEKMLSAIDRLKIVIPVTLSLIFALLYLMFGNIRDGLLVFSGVPFAICGGIWALWLRDIPFSISAAVGFIALSGIAVLNGIVMLTFIRNLREQGHTLEAAIQTGAMTRLRPVLMTALTDAIGFVPMALAVSIGAEVQRPLATVVIGGILTSTVLTLLVLPVLYQLAHKNSYPGVKTKSPEKT